MAKPTADELRDFRGYLYSLTDRQVQNCYRKEKDCGREEYALAAETECMHRGIEVPADDDCGPEHWRDR